MSATVSERSKKEPQRIAKLLARAGIASRREVERMIADGRIAIDGKTLDTPATLLTSLAGVTVDGKPVEAPESARLFLYHKPAGLLVTERDPKGRATIYDKLPKGLPRLMPVGRLDLNTEGLLLMTNDGGLKRQLELPSNGVERVYRARAFGQVSQAQLEELIEGVEIDGVRYGAIDANLERRTGANVWIEVRLAEGKNREVRRVLEHLGLKVSRLLRLSYGPFMLADLPSGEIGEVRQHDIVAFRKALGLPPAKRDRATVTAGAIREARPQSEAPEPPQKLSRNAQRAAAFKARHGQAEAKAGSAPTKGRSKLTAKTGKPRRPAEEPGAANSRTPRKPGTTGKPRRADGEPRNARSGGPRKPSGKPGARPPRRK